MLNPVSFVKFKFSDWCKHCVKQGHLRWHGDGIRWRAWSFGSYVANITLTLSLSANPIPTNERVPDPNCHDHGPIFSMIVLFW